MAAIADAITATFSGIVGLETYAYDPIGTDLVDPSACVVGFRIERVDLDLPERQIGSRTWTVDWAVHLYVRLVDPVTAYPVAYSLLGQMVAQMDADDQLGGEVLEAKLLSSSLAPSDPDQTPRQLIGQCELRTRHLMPDLTL
jgi:hypothetical protein